jgi:outer membrane lipoprotein-sorting protein
VTQVFRRPALGLVAILVLLLVVGAAAGAVAGCNRLDRATVVRKVGETFRKLQDYQGIAVKTISAATFEESMEVKQWFKKPNLHRVEIVSPPEIQGQTTIFDGETLWFYSPNDKEATVFRTPGPDISRGDRSDLAVTFAEQVMNASDSKIVGRQRLADRHTVILETALETDKARKRPTAIIARQRIWIDTTIWFPLMVESFDGEGKLVSSILFKEVRLNTNLSMNEFRFSPPPGIRIVEGDLTIRETTLAEARQMVTFGLAQPTYLPEKLVLRSVNRAGAGESVAIIFEYTNDAGITVSLTESAIEPGAPNLVGTRRVEYGGRTYEVIQTEEYVIMYWTATGVVFDLTGNLSMDEMLKIAGSVK